MYNNSNKNLCTVFLSFSILSFSVFSVSQVLSFLVLLFFFFPVSQVLGFVVFSIFFFFFSDINSLTLSSLRKWSPSKFWWSLPNSFVCFTYQIFCFTYWIFYKMINNSLYFCHLFLFYFTGYRIILYSIKECIVILRIVVGLMNYLLLDYLNRLSY